MQSASETVIEPDPTAEMHLEALTKASKKVVDSRTNQMTRSD
jgi:hypothetical protein